MSTMPYPSSQPVTAPTPTTLDEALRQLTAERSAHAVTRAERDEAQAIAMNVTDKLVAFGHEIADITQDRGHWRDYGLDVEARYVALREENARQAVTISDLESELRRSDLEHEREREDFLGQCAVVLGATPKAGVSIAKQILEVFDVQRDRIAAEHARAEEWRQGYEWMEKFLQSDAVSDSEKRYLLWRLGLDGIRPGLPVPDGVWPRYVTPEQMKASGLSEKTCRTAQLKFDELALFDVERKEPQVTVQAGRPYDLRRPNPARIAAFLDDLPTVEVRIVTERETQARERRKQSQARRDAEAEAREARLREQAQAAREIAAQRDAAQRAAEAAREEARARQSALEEAQRVITDYQRRPQITCQGCGQRFDAETWRCDDCREHDAPERQESIVPVLTATGTTNRPKVPNVVTVTNNSGGDPQKPQQPCPGCHGSHYHFVDSPRFGPEWRCVTCQPPI